MMDRSTRLVVVSNRLPVVLKKREGQWELIPGSGGLISAMAPVLKHRGGVWVGWTGASDHGDARELVSNFSREAGYDLRPLTLTAEEVKGFYEGFSNEIIWPLFHDLHSQCNFVPEYWRSYMAVNHKFALEVADVSREEDYVWVHDYHLMHVAWMLKDMGAGRKIGFFQHIPFPPVETFLKLPWRSEVIRALLEYDLVGFQTPRDRKNFVDAVGIFLPEAKARGRGPAIVLSVGDREIHLAALAVGIDYRAFQALASQKGVVEKAAEIRKAHHGRKIILGVDRLDYTKGIPQRLEAMRTAFLQYPDLLGKVFLLQVVVPSREVVPGYQALKEQIERLVGEINGQFTRSNYIPIHYQYRSLGKEDLAAYYRAAHMALVTPLRDGMNLVAKEYCACHADRDGVLFLSEFAGAASQLQNGAVLVNPYDVEGVARAIYRARNVMDVEERRQRMRKLQESIRKFDIFWWVDSFLEIGFSKHLDEFPRTEIPL